MLWKGCWSRPRSLLDEVLCEKVVRVRHGFELEAVAGGVLEEHGPLLARLALEAQVWLQPQHRNSAGSVTRDEGHAERNAVLPGPPAPTSMMNLTPAAFSLSLKAMKSATVRHTPKCGTGTSSLSAGSTAGAPWGGDALKHHSTAPPDPFNTVACRAHSRTNRVEVVLRAIR